MVGLLRHNVGTIARLKSSQSYLARATPELLTTLHRHHDVFRAMLQVNLTVLATAHAVSEGTVRGVSGELARRAAPQTYGANGAATAPARNAALPLALSRVLLTNPQANDAYGRHLKTSTARPMARRRLIHHTPGITPRVFTPLRPCDGDPRTASMWPCRLPMQSIKVR